MCSSGLFGAFVNIFHALRPGQFSSTEAGAPVGSAQPADGLFPACFSHERK